MSFVQEILKAVSADLMYENNYDNLIKGLSGIPECYHEDFVRAYFKREPEQPEEQPEDYLAVKTFSKRAQSSLQIGDELIDMHGVKSVFVGTDENGKISVVYGTGGVDHWNLDRLNRTGRNFPAIAAIMEELKKA